MSSVHFTEEHEAFRQQVRRFLSEEVAPHAAKWESQRRIPREIFVRMGELGFLGITAPETYGGSGADLFFGVVFLEELPRSLMGGFCAAVSVQQFMATPHILRAGSEELKRQYLAPSIAGKKVGALAITEPDTGSDVASLRTRAERHGDEYVVSGSKTFITNGADGDFFTLAVRTGRDPGAAGISLLAVDADLPGVEIAKRLDKLGWHCSDTAEIVFEGVRVPVRNRIGEENGGFPLLMESFELERLAAAAIAVGSAELALEEALSYMASRKAFGRPLNRFQALRHRIADLASELEAARQLTYHAAWLQQQKRPAVRESAMAKLVATEVGKRMADECLQVFGGYGYMEEYPAARFFRDARAATITAGTSEIMREIVARMGGDAAQRSVTPSPPKAVSATADPAPSAKNLPNASSAESVAPGSIAALMHSLPDRLRRDAVGDWRATFHCRIEGSAHPFWTLRVEDGHCEVEEGLQGSPDCLLESEEETFLAIQTGRLNPKIAFMLGRIKVSNVAELMRFVKSFRAADAR